MKFSGKQKSTFKLRLKKLGKEAYRSRYIYLLIFPAVIFYIIFNYIPMYGVKIAFLDFSPRKGISGSAWVGWDNFKFIFDNPEFWIVLRNTILISFTKIICSFIGAIAVAVMINELRMKRFKKGVQTILTFPHFLSWVIIAGFIRNLFVSDGAINNLIALFGGDRVGFLQDEKFFFGLIIFSDIWKEVGWSSIIYLAAMANIDPELYDAAEVDGASRMQQIWHITLPSIKSVAILLLILSTGGILDGGFDQIFNLYNPLVYGIADTIDTYIYRMTFGSTNAFNPGIGAAMGLFKGVVSMIMVFSVDRIAKLSGERGII